MLFELTEFHIEAAIASVHATASRSEDTDWGKIVSLYVTLMTIRPSPVVALNRAIAIGQLDGPERGLREICAINDRNRLTNYPFYFAAIGEFELRSGQRDLAREHFLEARRFARNPMERQFLDQRITACERAPETTQYRSLDRGF